MCLISSFSVVEAQDILLGSTILLSDDFSESEVDSWCTITDSATNNVIGQLHLLVTLVSDEMECSSDSEDSPPTVAAPVPPSCVTENSRILSSPEFSFGEMDGEKAPIKPAPPAPIPSLPSPPHSPSFSDEESTPSDLAPSLPAPLPPVPSVSTPEQQAALPSVSTPEQQPSVPSSDPIPLSFPESSGLAPSCEEQNQPLPSDPSTLSSPEMKPAKRVPPLPSAPKPILAADEEPPSKPAPIPPKKPTLPEKPRYPTKPMESSNKAHSLFDPLPAYPARIPQKEKEVEHKPPVKPPKPSLPPKPVKPLPQPPMKTQKPLPKLPEKPRKPLPPVPGKTVETGLVTSAEINSLPPNIVLREEQEQ